MASRTSSGSSRSSPLALRIASARETAAARTLSVSASASLFEAAEQLVTPTDWLARSAALSTPCSGTPVAKPTARRPKLNIDSEVRRARAPTSSDRRRCGREFLRMPFGEGDAEPTRARQMLLRVCIEQGRVEGRVEGLVGKVGIRGTGGASGRVGVGQGKCRACDARVQRVGRGV